MQVAESGEVLVRRLLDDCGIVVHGEIAESGEVLVQNLLDDCRIAIPGGLTLHGRWRSPLVGLAVSFWALSANSRSTRASRCSQAIGGGRAAAFANALANTLLPKGVELLEIAELDEIGKPSWSISW